MKTETHRMMKMAILLLALALSVNVYADEKTKVVEETYNVTRSTILEVNNKFGDVDVKNWDRDEAYIKVTITVEGHNADQALEILEDIDVGFSAAGDRIVATTEFSNKLDKGGFNWLKSGRFEYDVHYDIMVPEYISMEVNNKYGDVFINRLSGHFQCDVSYGKIQINALERGDQKPLNLINLAYGGGNIESLGWGKISMKYSNLEITEAKALITVTKYSKLFMDGASSLVSESKYDTYKVGSLSNFVAAAAYSNFKFKEVKEQFHIESKYSNGRVEYVPPAFEQINIESAYGKFNIGIDPSASYILEGEADYSKIYYVDGPWRIQRIEKGTSLEVDGIVGKDETTSSTVEIETRYGDVNLSL